MTMLTQKQLETLDLQSMLDLSLDDIPLPADFVTPPPGYYRLGITNVEEKTIGADELEGISISFTVLETMELSQKEVTPVPDDSLFSVLYFAGTGLAFMAKEFKAIAEANNITTLRGLVEELEGMEVYALVKNRTDKNDKEKKYPSVHQVTAV